MTIIQRACKDVPEFDIFYSKFIRKMCLNDSSSSTCMSYGRSLGAIALHFNKVPSILSLNEIEEYLYTLKSHFGDDLPSNFRFTIFALKVVFKMEGRDTLLLQLPKIKKSKRLPTVLSKQEVTAMLNIPCLLKHRVLIALLYGCGLRCSEVRNLKVLDIDFDRGLLHVKMSKGRKDRYLPLGNSLSFILKKYIQIQKPVVWLFSGKRYGHVSLKFFTEYDSQYGQRSIQWAITRAAHLAGIKKHINVHCLRHTYATHLLEDGVNLLSIKELLGHAHLSTTMIYLHVAQINIIHKCSPMDTLQGLKVIGSVQASLNFEPDL